MQPVHTTRDASLTAPASENDESKVKNVSIFRQIAIFADATVIPPTPAMIKVLMDLFGDHSFLPGVLQELSPGPTSLLAQGNLRQRLSLDESETGYHIDFGSKRIDLEQKARDLEGANMGSVADFLKTGGDLGERIMKKFELVAGRLAIVRKNLILDIAEPKLASVYQTLFKPTPFFTKNLPFEWIWHAVAKKSVEANGKVEEINCITKVVRSQGRIGDQRDLSSLLQVEFDVNTVPSRPQPRFDAQSLGIMLPKMADFHRELEEDVMGVLNDANKV